MNANALLAGQKGVENTLKKASEKQCKKKNGSQYSAKRKEKKKNWSQSNMIRSCLSSFMLQSSKH